MEQIIITKNLSIHVLKLKKADVLETQFDIKALIIAEVEEDEDTVKLYHYFEQSEAWIWFLFLFCFVFF